MRSSDRAITEGILFTDLYHLTTAQLYFRLGLHERRVQFDHFFRSYPDYGDHQAGYCVNAGLEWLLDWMDGAHVTDADITHLSAQTGATGERLFDDDFLGWLRAEGGFDGISMRAVPEGRVVHPNAPLTVVEGPLAMAQVLETPLLNLLNYQTLIATKAARVFAAGRSRPVMEFGMRRGPERGTIAGTRAALIGGATSSSNVGVSYALGYPPAGTHAHTLVQVFMAMGEGELGAFRAFADSYPDDCLLLVDTIDTLKSGVPNAITVFAELREKGHEPVGIRLDSGDLAYLAIQAASMLDEAGFPDVTIVLSSGLDELSIWQILTQIDEEASQYGVDAERLVQRLAYGVGTRLVSSHGSSALDGVYKAVALLEGDRWIPTLKLSESRAKVPNPGAKDVWRLYDDRKTATADVVAARGEDVRASDPLWLYHPTRESSRRTLTQAAISEAEPLLVDVMRDGMRVALHESIEDMRQRREADLARLDPGVRRLINPHVYHVSLTEKIWDQKRRLIAEAQSSG